MATIAAQLRAQLAHIESLIALLQAQRHTVHEQLAAVVYPILTLPNEVTAEIFLRYYDNCDDLSCTPLVLTNVCSLWREVAISTRRLWSIFASRRPEYSTPTHASALQLWISRAGKLPLDGRIRLADSTYPTHAEPLRLISQHSSRWQSLALYIIYGGEIDVVDLPGHFPHLTKLLVFTGMTLPKSLDAPRLVDVALQGAELPEHWETCLPWNQLINLCLTDRPVGFCVQILEHTPNLQVLEMRCDDDDWETTTPTRILHHLHTLVIIGYNSSVITHLTLPGLRELRLGSGSDIEDCGPAVKSLLDRSGCSLQLHTLAFSVCNPVAISDHLSGLDTIQKVQLNSGGLDSNSFSLLMETLSKENHLFPALTDLEILNCGPMQVNLSNLVSVLRDWRNESRTTRLRAFKMSSPGKLDVVFERVHERVEESLKELRDLRDGGLQVDVGSERRWFEKGPADKDFAVAAALASLSFLSYNKD
ncbi:hypothetical protein FB45DRAFT_801783 [Roridomyces roridus]|uniref:F-box domain-containing protein n=1 Tax=Roridomyces roridus TaxID=1738132 RepID=A0AAD7BAI8_9AGAR|nr:hypothetical protein FB45DRAFT_801783 [Roridomyces roridus]